MKVYLSKDGRFEAPGKQSKGAEKIDVPTDTAGLVDYLNELTANVPPQDALEFEQPPVDPVVNWGSPSLAVPAKGPPKTDNPDYNRDWSKTEISDFILNRASVSQVEDLFACLGTRFKELAKEQAGELTKGGGIA